jgi:hypothetical protein
VKALPKHCFIFNILITLLFSGCSEQTDNSSKIQHSVSEDNQKKITEITDLDLRAFYKFPVGPRGLEPTKELLNLNDKHVRVSGYIVKEEEPTEGLFMLSPIPVSMAEKEDGPADDLPPATLYVHTSSADKSKLFTYHPGKWQLTGILKLGNQEEANGRVSYTRLILD